MKKQFLSVLFVFLSGVALSTICKPASAMDSPIMLRWSHAIPTKSAFHQKIYLPLIEQIEKETKAIGKPVKIKIFPAGALGSHNDQYKLVLTGTVDIVGNWGPADMPGKFPLTDVFNLPMLFKSARVFILVAQDIYKKYPQIQKELGEAKLLFFQPTPAQQIQSSARPIKVLNDFKGLKVLARGGVNGEAIKALGGAPVTMPVPEVYTALERGLLDVAPINWEGCVAFKWYEVTKYRTVLPNGLFITNLMCSMNWDSWKKLPKEVQNVFSKLTGPSLIKLTGDSIDGTAEHLRGVIERHDQKAGNPKIYSLSKEEFRNWKNAVKPVYEKWISETEAKGLPARAVFNDIVRLSEKYSK